MEKEEKQLITFIERFNDEFECDEQKDAMMRFFSNWNLNADEVIASFKEKGLTSLEDFETHIANHILEGNQDFVNADSLVPQEIREEGNYVYFDGEDYVLSIYDGHFLVDEAQYLHFTIDDIADKAKNTPANCW